MGCSLVVVSGWLVARVTSWWWCGRLPVLRRRRGGSQKFVSKSLRSGRFKALLLLTVVLELCAAKKSWIGMQRLVRVLYRDKVARKKAAV